jgi:hypothetical protein
MHSLMSLLLFNMMTTIKNMKKLIKPIVFTLTFFALTACEDYLEVVPPGELAPGNVLTTEKGTRALLYSAYESHNLGAGVGKNIINMMETTTDMAFNSGGGENRTLTLFINFQWDASVGWIEHSMWNQSYSAIRDANLVVDNIERIEQISEAKRKQFEAEARYIRAASYSLLYNWFGPVPLRTSSEQDPHLARASEEEMKNFIETELSEVVADLPAPGEESEYGRATKGHALAMLTKYFLNTKQWQKTVDASQQLMDLGYYELFSEFRELFRVENEPHVNPSNKEMIVVWPAIADVPYGNPFPNGAFPPGFVSAPSLPEFTWDPSMNNWATQYRLRDEFIETFDQEQDKRFGLIITEYVNKNGDLIDLLSTPDNARSFKYFDNNALGNHHGNDYAVIRYADILLSRAEALNELNGPTQEALDLINQVRNRAGIEELSTVEAGGKEQFRNLILEERGKEFVSEAKRREDLIRHDKFISSAQARGKSAQPFHVRFPIPQSEINANDAVTANDQNPGY